MTWGKSRGASAFFICGGGSHTMMKQILIGECDVKGFMIDEERYEAVVTDTEEAEKTEVPVAGTAGSGGMWNP